MNQSTIDTVLEAIKSAQAANLNIKTKEPTQEIIDDYWVQETILAELTDWCNGGCLETLTDAQTQSLRHAMLHYRTVRLNRNDYQKPLMAWNELTANKWI